MKEVGVVGKNRKNNYKAFSYFLILNCYYNNIKLFNLYNYNITLIY